MGGGVATSSKIRGLDFGCGIGRITLMLNEFDIEAYGIDISEVAISQAKEILNQSRFDSSRVFVYNGKNIPFENNYFDFTISEGVMDSVPFKMAQALLKEIERVTKTYFYVSLISSSSISQFKQGEIKEFDGEITVSQQHEFGTIQSFYTLEKITKLISGTSFKIIWGELIENYDILQKIKYGRYHLVLEKQS